MAADFDRIKEEIRRRTDLADLVGQRVSLKKTGRGFTGLCPFHDDRNPSFNVNPTLGIYKCWSCGATGDAFKWVMETQRVDFMDAMRILGKAAGVEIPQFTGKQDSDEPEQMEAAMADALAFFRDQLRSDTHAQEYLRLRGIDKETADAWEIGYGPPAGEALALTLKKKGHNLPLCQQLFLVDRDQSGGYYDRFRGRIMFPIRDERGRLVAFGGRVTGQGQPKYINSSDTPLYSKSRVLYGMNRAKEAIARAGQAVLVEGYLDVIACHRAGVGQAVASLGTALADDHVRLLKRWCSQVVVLYDADEAGQKAADRASLLLAEGGLSVKVALAPAGEDPDTLLKQKGAAAVVAAVEQGVSPMDFRMGRLNAKLDPESDAYWKEVVEILATAETPLELQKHLIPVAAKYPGIRDRQAAAKALERMVAKARNDRKRKDNPRQAKIQAEEDVEPVAVEEQLKPGDLAGPEKVVFLSLFAPALVAEAWKFACHAPLMKTALGTRVARSLEGLGAAAPRDDRWPHQIQDAAIRTLLFDLAMQSGEPIELPILEEAVDRLSRDLEARTAQLEAEAALTAGAADDEALRNINDRLRRLKGGKSPQNSS
ncbi:MAG: DNA primase [Armatimonadetes bacterium]|nr:DNA primase [Armatimonadota bacterium]